MPAPETLPSLLIRVEEESMRMFSVRLSPLLRSSLDSLPSPEGMSFRLKLGKKPNVIGTEVYSFRSSQQTAWM